MNARIPDAWLPFVRECTLDEVAAASLQVVSRMWITCGGQPELHLALNDGSSVLIQWSIECAMPMLFVAAAGEDFLACTAAQTGLNPDELDGLIDEVMRAVRADDEERMADSAPDFDEYGVTR